MQEMEGSGQSPAGNQSVDARQASSGNLNSNTDLRNGAEDMMLPSRFPSGAPRLGFGQHGGLVAVKQEIDTARPRVSDEALLWEGAAASAPSENIGVGHLEPAADDKSLIHRLTAASKWSRPPTNLPVSQSTPRVPISQTRISHELPLGQIAAAQSQDTPAGRQTVHDGALPGHAGALRDSRASPVSAAEIGMVAETSGGDSKGARRGTTEAAMDRDAQRAATFVQEASRAVDHSVGDYRAGSADRASALNYPGTESVQEHITVCSVGGGIGSLDPVTLTPRAASHAGVGGPSLPRTAAEQHDRVGARLESIPGLSDSIRHAGAGPNDSDSPRLGTPFGVGLDAGGSARLGPGTATIATAPRPGATGLRLAQGNRAQGSGQDEGDGTCKTSTDMAPSRADSVSGLLPASSFPRRSNQSTASALLAGQKRDVSAASGLAEGSASGATSQQTAQSGPAIPRVVPALSHILPLDFLAGTSLPADDITAHKSHDSPAKARHAATDNDVGGSASAASVEMETTQPESLPLALESEQPSIRQEATRLASPEEHAMSDSAGDTVDIALAALSYADAAASASPRDESNSVTAVGFDNGSAGQDRHFFSSSAGGELATENLALREHEQVEGGGNFMSSFPAAAPTAAPLAAGASTHSEESSLDALASRSCAPIVVPLPSGATEAGSNGFTEPAISRREKGARARDRRDDMMHAMCMICLEKFCEPADGGGAKLLGLLDSCSHRHCYKVSLGATAVSLLSRYCRTHERRMRANLKFPGQAARY